jgi:hypothetical protein
LGARVGSKGSSRERSAISDARDEFNCIWPETETSVELDRQTVVGRRELHDRPTLSYSTPQSRRGAVTSAPGFDVKPAGRLALAISLLSFTSLMLFVAAASATSGLAILSGLGSFLVALENNVARGRMKEMADLTGRVNRLERAEQGA